MKRTTLEALLPVYTQIEEIITKLYKLADTAVEMGFEDASLLRARAGRLYKQMENSDFVISELER